MKNIVNSLYYKSVCSFVAENKKPLFLIFVIVLIGNIFGIIGDEGLYLDDHFRYTFAIHNDFPWYIGKRNFVRPFIIYPIYELMSVSAPLARLAETILFLVPTSFFFYGLFRGVLKLSFSISLAAAIIPNILPAQEAIPSFIDGSYTVQGLLFVLPTIFFGYDFCKNRSKLSLFFALGFYVLGLEMMDQVIFLLAPFSVFFFYFGRKFKNKGSLGLIIGSTIFALVKVVQSILNPVSANTVKKIELFEILSRFKESFFQSNPFAFFINFVSGTKESSVGILVSVFLMISGLCFFIPALSRKLKIQDRELPYIVTWGIIWALATSIPFFLISPHYSSRYMHISAFGANLSILISLYLCFSYFRLQKIVFPFFMCVLLGSCILRGIYLNNYFKASNSYVSLMKKELNLYSFVKNAQIAVVGKIGIPTGSFWHYSSGALRLYLKRKDIEGNIGEERTFYNPFLYPEGQAFTYTMNGFELGRPLYLFRLVDKKLKPMKYALQWMSERNPSADWNLREFSPVSGELVNTFSGKGIKELESKLTAVKLSTKDVLWLGEHLN